MNNALLRDCYTEMVDLCEACCEGNLDRVKWLIDVGKWRHNDHHTNSNQWIFNSTCEMGHLPVVKYLAEESGIDVRIHPALQVACEKGQLHVVKYFVEERNANIHEFSEDALQIASKRGQLHVVEYLTEKGADIQADENLALMQACSYGHLDVVKYLIEKGADVNALDCDALVRACEEGHLEVVKHLVDEGGKLPMCKVALFYCNSCNVILYVCYKLNSSNKFFKKILQRQIDLWDNDNFATKYRTMMIVLLGFASLCSDAYFEPKMGMVVCSYLD